MRARFSRLWRRGRPAAATSQDAPTDPLLAAGVRLRLRREERQLSLRELAMETRISTAVLEALERGWRDRLPEPAYLRTMLPLIERHLQLEAGSLHAVLPDEQLRQQQQQQQRRGSLLQRFTPGSIDVFTSWQGTVLYGLITLGLIYGLNLQQRRLASEGLLTVAPLPSSSSTPAQRQRADKSEGREMLLRRYPDLQPLEQAASGQGLRLWRRANSP
ncbi:MAG: helix-turn-helix domain-containing protein [Cyanobacteriota bacterium]|nr:helix-turn-helix domain-containing protein [Cyanobacteriota bacterium]